MNTTTDPIPVPNHPTCISVLCVDDTVKLTDAYRTLLDRQTDMKCVGCLDSADTLLHAARTLRPDVILLDLTMPGLPPLTAIASLAADHIPARVLAFSGYDDADTRDAVFTAGGWGLVSKLAEPAEVLEAIRVVARGGTRFEL